MRLRKLTWAIRDLAYRFGIEVRRAHPVPRSGRVPSNHDPFHEQRRMLADVASPVIFDVGAHVGLTTLQYKELFPRATVYSFEPCEDSFRMLLAATEKVPGVKPVNKALGRVPGEATLRLNQLSATNSLLATDPRARETWNGTDVTETISETVVQVETLDGFLRANGSIASIDVLKLDAQGSEMDILLGASETLGNGRVRILYTEIIVMPTYAGQRNLDEYLAFLREHGFALHNLYNPLFSNAGQLNQLDALFVRPDLVHVD